MQVDTGWTGDVFTRPEPLNTCLTSLDVCIYTTLHTLILSPIINLLRCPMPAMSFEVFILYIINSVFLQTNFTALL